MAEHERITVSRELLRAELSEMELRLRIYFDEQLKHKVDAERVDKLEHDFVLLQRTALLQEGPIAQEVAANTMALKRLNDGEFTKSQILTLEDVIDERLAERAKNSWTLRERKVTLLSLAVSVLVVVLTAIYTLHSVGWL